MNRKVVKKNESNNTRVPKAATAKYEERSHIRLLPLSAEYLSNCKYDPQIDYSRDKAVYLGSRLLCTSCRDLKW